MTALLYLAHLAIYGNTQLVLLTAMELTLKKPLINNYLTITEDTEALTLSLMFIGS